MPHLKVLLAAFCALAPAAAVSADDCVTVGDRRVVTLDCRGVPLGTILRGLGAVTPIDSTLVEPAALEARVYVAVRLVPVGEALRAALDAAGVSFVLYGFEEPNIRVFAASSSATAVATTTPPSSKEARGLLEDKERALQQVVEIEAGEPAPEPVAVADVVGPPPAAGPVGPPTAAVAGGPPPDGKGLAGMSSPQASVSAPDATGEAVLQRAFEARRNARPTKN